MKPLSLETPAPSVLEVEQVSAQGAARPLALEVARSPAQEAARPLALEVACESALGEAPASAHSLNARDEHKATFSGDEHKATSVSGDEHKATFSLSFSQDKR